MILFWRKTEFGPAPVKVFAAVEGLWPAVLMFYPVKVGGKGSFTLWKSGEMPASDELLKQIDNAMLKLQP